MLKLEKIFTRVNELQALNAISDKCSYEVSVQQGSFKTRANSIIGVLNICLGQPVMITLNTSDTAELCKFQCLF